MGMTCRSIHVPVEDTCFLYCFAVIPRDCIRMSYCYPQRAENTVHPQCEILCANPIQRHKTTSEIFSTLGCAPANTRVSGGPRVFPPNRTPIDEHDRSAVYFSQTSAAGDISCRRVDNHCTLLQRIYTRHD